MNELDRNFISALNRKVQKTPPVWIMRQAGRYLPEYRKVRSNRKGFFRIDEQKIEENVGKQAWFRTLQRNSNK